MATAAVVPTPDAVEEASSGLDRTASDPMPPLDPGHGQDHDDGAATEDREELLARWNDEAADPVWTQRHADYIAQAIVDLRLDARLVEASCKTTLCRTRLEFADLTEAGQLQDAAAEPARQKGVFVEARGDLVAIEVFSVREADVAQLGAIPPETHRPEVNPRATP